MALCVVYYSNFCETCRIGLKTWNVTSSYLCEDDELRLSCLSGDVCLCCGLVLRWARQTEILFNIISCHQHLPWIQFLLLVSSTYHSLARHCRPCKPSSVCLMSPHAVRANHADQPSQVSLSATVLLGRSVSRRCRSVPYSPPTSF